jgi:hypothetical protein
MVEISECILSFVLGWVLGVVILKHKNSKTK